MRLFVFRGELRYSASKKCVFIVYDFYCFMNSLSSMPPHTTLDSRPDEPADVVCYFVVLFLLLSTLRRENTILRRHDSHPEINRCNIDNKKIYSFFLSSCGREEFELRLLLILVSEMVAWLVDKSIIESF